MKKYASSLTYGIITCLVCGLGSIPTDNAITNFITLNILFIAAGLTIVGLYFTTRFFRLYFNKTLPIRDFLINDGIVTLSMILIYTYFTHYLEHHH